MTRMYVDTDHLATLLQVQHIDLELMRVNKELSELPQRAIILEARTKRRDIEQKRAKLDELHADAEARLTRISAEDEKLAEKQKHVQEEMDSAKSGYRDIEARSREMNGYAKRRNTLDGDLSAVGDELAKIEGMQAQVAQLLADLDARESAATETFVKEGGALKQTSANLEAQRASLLATLPDEVVRTYEKTAERTGGGAVGRLQGSTCGVCRVGIEGGRLIDMKRQGNVATCPQCGRLLILEDGE